MAKRTKVDETGDSDDLQALFDSIAAGNDKETPAQAPPAPPPPIAAVAAPAGDTDDNDELQALFDAEASKFGAPPGRNEGKGDDGDDAVFHRIGKMTRRLHDTLIELGLDNALQEVADSIPDARQRLTYVAQMTEQAASRVLNATDIAKPAAERIENEAGALHARWDKAFSNQLSVGEFRDLSVETRAFLGAAVEGGRELNAQLLEIMMAQDFQDLTGQVIKKVVQMAQSLETQLLEMLIEVAPENLRAEKAGSLLNGPVVSSTGRDDVVTSQGQVDDLLESLGF
ncbi:MAG: protein phosphatase CheZ [Azoarcus sp.]|nr:protein phosphatase CheZ [Azoarcus sp.]